MARAVSQVQGRVGGAYVGRDVRATVTERKVEGRIGGNLVGWDINLAFDSAGHLSGRVGGRVFGRDVSGRFTHEWLEARGGKRLRCRRPVTARGQSDHRPHGRARHRQLLRTDVQRADPGAHGAHRRQGRREGRELPSFPGRKASPGRPFGRSSGLLHGGRSALAVEQRLTNVQAAATQY
jgi:hypothetical protein